MEVNIAGVVIMVLFYVAIVIVGIMAAKRFKGQEDSTATDLSIVAGRNLSLGVGMMTTAATFVGGGYINGTAEGVANSGLAWTLTPFGICIGTTIGGFLYAPPMRRRRYLTMLDPLQERYGDAMTGLLFLGATFGDLLWAASILGALGTSLSVIVGIPVPIAIVVSTIVGVTYTIFGQMVAVAYTDILQLVFMVFGLVLCVPFAMTHPAVEDIGKTSSRWLGSISTDTVSPWIDFAIIQVCGSIPWQTYFQRVLSTRCVAHAQIVSIVGGFSALLLGVPPVLIGAVGVSTNWTATGLGKSPIDTPEVSKILPLVLQYLTPTPVAVIGLAAVAAAVMSSLDSIILSSSSMFTQNVYRMSIRRQASDKELIIVQRVALFVTAAIAAVLAIFVQSIFLMFYLAADIVYVVLFPQLTLALATTSVNAYGSLVGLVLGLVLRLSGGEPGLFPPLIKYPFYNDKAGGQVFPFKTFAMLCSLVSNLLVSNLMRVLFARRILPRKWDVACCSGDSSGNRGKPSVEPAPEDSNNKDTTSTRMVTKF